MNRSEFQLSGHTCQLLTPENLSGGAVLYLHDSQTRMPSEVPGLDELLEQHGLLCLAPVAADGWWADRLYEPFDAGITPLKFLRQAVQHLHEGHQIAPRQVALLGIEMGGQGALRMAFLAPRELTVVAALRPAIDHQVLFSPSHPLARMYRDDEAVRQDTATLHIHPLNYPLHTYFSCPSSDPWLESCERLAMKMYSLGIPHTFDSDCDAADETAFMAEKLPTAVEFVAQGLKRERLRIL